MIYRLIVFDLFNRDGGWNSGEALPVPEGYANSYNGPSAPQYGYNPNAPPHPGMNPTFEHSQQPPMGQPYAPQPPQYGREMYEMPPASPKMGNFTAPTELAEPMPSDPPSSVSPAHVQPPAPQREPEKKSEKNPKKESGDSGCCGLSPYTKWSSERPGGQQWEQRCIWPGAFLECTVCAPCFENNARDNLPPCRVRKDRFDPAHAWSIVCHENWETGCGPIALPDDTNACIANTITADFLPADDFWYESPGPWCLFCRRQKNRNDKFFDHTLGRWSSVRSGKEGCDSCCDATCGPPYRRVEDVGRLAHHALHFVLHATVGHFCQCFCGRNWF